MNYRHLPLFSVILLLGACGAPDDSIDAWTPPEEGATEASSTPTQALGDTPTYAPTPTRVPVAWDDYQLQAATLDGAVLDLWVGFEDEAVAITERILDELVAAGTISAIEAIAYQQAAEILYAQVFTEKWVNESISSALNDQTLNMTQRVTPGGGSTFLLEYYVWNLSNDPEQSRLASLTGEGNRAAGDITFDITIPTFGEPVNGTLHILDADVFVAPTFGNTMTGDVPYSDVEALILEMAVSSMNYWQVPFEEQEAYLVQVEAALDELSETYATTTLDNGGKALPMNVRYDATQLGNGSLP